MPKGRSSSSGSSRSGLTKSGKPDMRFAANRAAAGMPTGTGSRGGRGGSRSGPITKSGKPDMRFTENRAAAGLPTGLGSRGGGGVPVTNTGMPDMRYAANRAAAGLPIGHGSRGGCGEPTGPVTNTGMPDMRYAANREAAGLPIGHGSRGGCGEPTGPVTNTGMPDMRYAANREAAGLPIGLGSRGGCTGPVTNTDMPDMRFPPGSGSRGALIVPAPHLPAQNDTARSSGVKTQVDKSTCGASDSTELCVRLTKKGLPDRRFKIVRELMEKEKNSSYGIPSYVKTKNDGSPDMRNIQAKEWVTNECLSSARINIIPPWVPRTKSGILKDSALARAYFQAVERLANNVDKAPIECDDCNERIKQDKIYADCVERFENVDIPLGTAHSIELPKEANNDRDPEVDIPEWYNKIPKQIKNYSYNEIIFHGGSELGNEIGRGSFGVVYEGQINGKDYAVKRLHVKCILKQKPFITELNALARFGEHVNIIKIEGYTFNPPCIIMELAAKNSLYYQLYENDIPEDVAALYYNKYRMKIVFGIANALAQLVKCGFVHGDIKPQNILLDEDFTPKLCDFGMTRLRSRVKSSSSSQATDTESEILGGTYSYLAPELLEFNNDANEKTDVYSFGILFNEVMTRKYPYAEQFRKFACRPIDSVAKYAACGNRPKQCPTAPEGINDLIDQCWHKNPSIRPSFDKIMDELSLLKTNIDGDPTNNWLNDL